MRIGGGGYAGGYTVAIVVVVVCSSLVTGVGTIPAASPDRTSSAASPINTTLVVDGEAGGDNKYAASEIGELEIRFSEFEGFSPELSPGIPTGSEVIVQIESGNIDFDKGSNYEIRVRNQDTGGYLAVTVEGTWTADDNFWLTIFDPDNEPVIFESGGTNRTDVSVSQHGEFPEGGVANLSLSIVETGTNEPVAETGTQMFVLRHCGALYQDSTSGIVRVGVPRDTFPEESSVNVSIFDSSLTFPHQVEDPLELQLSYHPETDTFRGSFNADELESGEYGWYLDVTLPDGANIEKPHFDLHNLTVNETDVDLEPPDMCGTQAPDLSGDDGTGGDQSPPGDITGDGQLATDPDGDGKYEDVNGDGDVTPGDATVLFNAVFEGNSAVTENAASFDFNGDGSVTPGDATVLFKSIF